jgi:hypothetical protein
MARLTITISDEIHQALKQAALRQGKSMGRIIEESLEEMGIESDESAAAIVARARELSAMSEGEAIELAAREAKLQRNGR